MTLAELCKLTDTYYIAPHKDDLDTKYTSKSSEIYTDGRKYSHVDKDGFIIVEHLTDANYIVYIDELSNVCLWVYENVSEILYKQIIADINKIRKYAEDTKKKQQKPKKQSKAKTTDANSNQSLNIDTKDLIDVNDFSCPKCKNVITSKSIKGNSIICTCDVCNIEYELVPSKYYLIKSMKVNTNIDGSLIPICG